MNLHPYMGWSGGDPADGALLVFATNAREARPIAYCGCSSWYDIAYTDVRVRRLRTHADYLIGLADQDKLRAGLAHYVDDPPSCNRCDQWGTPINEFGICEDCMNDDVKHYAEDGA